MVSQRIGHASPTVALTLYSHVLPGHDEAAWAKNRRVEITIEGVR